jgi:hypothetical protein
MKILILFLALTRIYGWTKTNSEFRSLFQKSEFNRNPNSFKKVSVLVSLAISFQSISLSALAFGPVEIPITILSYKPVDLCNGQKPIMPGQKAAEGLFPLCIEVDAEVQSPETSKVLTDVSVYGFVKENDAGNSVLPNNPDFKSDSGQYAMVYFKFL